MDGANELTPQDIHFSQKLLDEFLGVMPKQNNVIDIGAGSGRVARLLLSNYFNHIDLLDPVDNSNEANKALYPIKVDPKMTLQSF